MKKLSSNDAMLIFANILAIATAVWWLTSDFPLAGILWSMLWLWVLYRMQYERRKREEMIERFEMRWKELENRKQPPGVG